MKIPVLTLIIIVFILWLHYEVKKSQRNSKEETKEFWEREHASNLVRRTDISNLNYLTIQPELLPMSDTGDPTITTYQSTIQKLLNIKMLNLSGYTNTDLKLKYGTANFNTLCDCDNNYTLFVSTLDQWGNYLYSKGHLPEALCVLEYAVSCNSDISKTYLLLARIYKEQNTPQKINTLLDRLTDINIFYKDTILKDIQKYQSEK